MRAKDFDLEKLLGWLKKYELSELTIKDGKFLVTLKKESPKSEYARSSRPAFDGPATSSRPGETVPLPKKEMPPPDATLVQETQVQKGPVANLHEVKAPLVGTFYRAPAPDAAPFVEEGDEVGINNKLCIIEAMKIMNEIESPISGTVRQICIKNGTPVEFGQVLFRIEPDR